MRLLTVTYNLELAIVMLLVWFAINAIALTGLGLMNCKKKDRYDFMDTISGIVFVTLIIIPVFF
jgi:hypothetical protein